jgi:hypothetical protein
MYITDPVSANLNGQLYVCNYDLYGIKILQKPRLFIVHNSLDTIEWPKWEDFPIFQYI